MQIVLFALLVQTTVALSGYLSQLGAGNVVNSNVNGQGNGGSAFFFPVPTQPVAAPASSAVGGPSQEMLSLVSRQVSVELMASQSYMSASIWFRSRGMDGMAAWMLEESDEERGHGKQILEFAMKSKFPVSLEALEAPRSDWQNPAEVWAHILALEQNNTKNLLAIAGAAERCGQYGMVSFLGPFHEEQIDAEAKVGGILAKVNAASDDFLWELDHHLGLEAALEEQH